MSQVEDIRRALRISNDSLDDEIRDTIDAAVLDLRTAGAGRGGCRCPDSYGSEAVRPLAIRLPGQGGAVPTSI